MTPLSSHAMIRRISPVNTDSPAIYPPNIHVSTIRDHICRFSYIAELFYSRIQTLNLTSEDSETSIAIIITDTLNSLFRTQDCAESYRKAAYDSLALLGMIGGIRCVL